MPLASSLLSASAPSAPSAPNGGGYPVNANAAVVQLGARATRPDADQLRRWVSRMLEQGASLLVVDLGASSYVDSHVLSALVDGLRAACEQRAEVVLAAPRTSVRVILELTRLHTVFDVFDSVDDAVGSAMRVAS